MNVFHSLEACQGKFGPCALAIGNFDGVHVGHQFLLRNVVEEASLRGVVPAVLTFDPHPTAIVAPDRLPKMICTVEERVRLLGLHGAFEILVLPFTLELSRLSPEQFVKQVLVDVLQARTVCVGSNFRFGYQQSGDIDTLVALGKRWDLAANIMAPVNVCGETVSSSVIRGHLRASRVSRARHLLGRCFSVRGTVVKGQGIGSTQTVPTLNILPDPTLVLPHGIFITDVSDSHTGWCAPSITSIGTRPTFQGEGITIETYVLAALPPKVPVEIEVRLRRFLREEQFFPSAADLKRQILRDVARAQVYWRRAPRG